MRRVDDPDNDMPGGDSFLDIVANIVGILVLLVVVVGVRAGRQVFVPPTVTEDAESLDELESQVADAVRAANLSGKEVADLRTKVANAAAEADRRNRERQAAMMYLATLREELDDARLDLSEKDRRSLDTQNEIAQAQLKLERLTREQIALASIEPEPDTETVVVAPTPIVDGRAERTISFRLLDDRLVYVPVNELEVELAAKVSAPTITDPTRSIVTRESLGPVEGFTGQAEIRWAVRARGNRVGIRASLGKLVLNEVTPLRGEDVDTAFGPGGYVGSRLELLDPNDIVVRLIVYDDSFESAPEVNQRFRERGFRVAQSLKSEGQSIGFSSDGYQAVTQ